jgi:hypothetical protein
MEPVIKPGDMRSTHDKTDNTTGIPDERSDTGPLKDGNLICFR